MIAEMQAFVQQTVESCLEKPTFIIPDGYLPNAFENAWMEMFNYGNPWLVITVFSLCLHEIFYFGRYIPYMIYDQIPSLQKYKLQEDKVVTSEERWHCTRQVLFVHFFYAGAYIVFFYPVAKTLGLDFFKIPFPDWKELFVHLAVCFIVEDSWHYWLHRAMHYGPFYKYIHKVHHEYSAPFGIAAEYAHPIEVALLGLGSFLGPMLILGVSGNMHAITAEAFVALRICQAVEAHSGYDLPWSLHNIIPFWAGAEHHDFHHQAFVDCYASSFRWNDSIFGTDSKYHSARERMRQKKLKMSQNKDKTQ